MEIAYVLPSPHLRTLLSVFGHVRGFCAPARAVVPALLPTLHIWLAGLGRYDLGPRGISTAPRVSLVGPTSAAFGVEVPAGFELICVGFLPDGWHSIVAERPDVIADMVLDAGAIWPASAVDRLWHAVAEKQSLDARRHVLEEFFLGRMSSRSRQRAHHLRTIQTWLEAPGSLGVDVLRQRVELSARQTTRVTLDLYGHGPKELAMKYRALRAASLLSVYGYDAYDAAVASYADQSHLIRDFRRFIGNSPGQMLVDDSVAARMMLRGRWQARSPSITARLS